jgi:hypothetical protein
VSEIDGLLRNRATLEALTKGEDAQRIAEDWQDAIEVFNSLRAKYLLY